MLQFYDYFGNAWVITITTNNKLENEINFGLSEKFYSPAQLWKCNKSWIARYSKLNFHYFLGSKNTCLKTPPKLFKLNPSYIKNSKITMNKKICKHLQQVRKTNMEVWGLGRIVMRVWVLTLEYHTCTHYHTYYLGTQYITTL